MADLYTSQNSLISSMPSSFDDDFDDSCSICLEPFSIDHPSTATNCNHEYHLHCILEWSQRSTECPICWQSFSLKDPSSQELLGAIHTERNARRRHITTSAPVYRHQYQESDSDNVPHWADDSDFNERIMQHLAAMMTRARRTHRDHSQGSSEQGPLPVLLFQSHVSESTMHPNTPEEWSSANGSSSGSSPLSNRSSLESQHALLPTPSSVNLSSVPQRDIHDPSRPLQGQSSDCTPRPRSSEFLAFSDSIKSKLSAASTRYKDSISKGTQGFKDKFLAHNSSVKELSKGVQREMNAGIAGVARMIERLDLKSKRSSLAVEGFNDAGQTSNLFSKGKGVLDNILANSCENYVVVDQGFISNDQSHGACSIPNHEGIYHVE